MRSFSWKMKNWYWMEKQPRAQCLKLLKNVQITHLSMMYVAHFDPKNYSVYTINFAGGKVRVGHVRGHMSMVLSWPSISFAHWKWIHGFIIDHPCHWQSIAKRNLELISGIINAMKSQKTPKLWWFSTVGNDSQRS